MDFKCLVLACSLHVFTDDQVVAQASSTAIQNRHRKGVHRQAVAIAQRRHAIHRRPHRQGGGVEFVLVAQPPNVVVARFAKHREIEVGLFCCGQNGVGRVAHQKQIFSLHRIAVIPEGDQRAFCSEACLGLHISSGGQDCSSIARRNFTGFAHNLNGLHRKLGTPVFVDRGHVIQGGPSLRQRRIVRHRVNHVRSIAQPLHVDGCAREHVDDLTRVVHHDQSCGRRRGVALVGETKNDRAQICAHRAVVGVVE